MRRTVVKIDLCGSKEHVDRSGEPDDVRTKNVQQLVDSVRAIFPEADRTFPDGSYYRSEGDATYVILEKATVALRCSVEFAKAWFSRLGVMPDCRVVVSTGELSLSPSGEWTSEAFETISVAEKGVKPGQILVDAESVRQSDRTLFQFIGRREVSITSVREVVFFELNYEDPRSASDSALVHAVFVADAKAAEARGRSYEVLALEFVGGLRSSSGPLGEFEVFLESKGCPIPDRDYLRDVFKSSTVVTLSVEDYLSVPQSVLEKLDGWRGAYEAARGAALESISARMGSSLGLRSHLVLEKVDVGGLTEKFLNAVFLEVRLMANYYRSTEQFFERLAASGDYDYILRRHLSNLAISGEQFTMLKRIFLQAIRELTLTKNSYVSAVFHNVLMLYYLNRNERYTKRQLSMIRQKEFYLDTNALYALMVEASEYHGFLEYAVRRLRSLGVEVCIFDASVIEYNDSLFSAMNRERQDRGFGYEFRQDRPWIWQEFAKDTTRYQNSFEYCVRLHAIPKGVSPGEPFAMEGVARDLSDRGLKLMPLLPLKGEDELGELYVKVSEAKRRWVRDSEGNFYSEEPAGLEFKVLHDANCVERLQCRGASPYDTRSVFVTCDFRLSRVRKANRDWNFIATIPEFQEFIMPYLLIADEFNSVSVDVPNMLLAASIDLELAHTTDFAAVVGSFLRSREQRSEDYDLLSSIKQSQKFREVATKLDKARESGDRALEREAWADAGLVLKEYKESTRGSLAKSVAQSTLDEQKAEIEELNARVAMLEGKLAVTEKRKIGKERYDRAQERRRK